MANKIVRLNKKQVEDIVETLRYNIQFWSPTGTRANYSTGDEIRKVLLAYYGPRKYKKVRLPK
jgi:hypothetical protein